MPETGGASDGARKGLTLDDLIAAIDRAIKATEEGVEEGGEAGMAADKEDNGMVKVGGTKARGIKAKGTKARGIREVKAPRLRDELKGRLSRRLVPNVHLGTILPKEAEWAESGTKMDWKCVACGTVDLVVKGSKCAAMVDTGAEMNIIREADAIRFGLDIDRSDCRILHGASCKAVFCGTASNVLIKVGKVKARACFFIMPDVDHGILLGRSFLSRTETVMFNKHDGTLILLLCDPACGNYEIITCRNTGPRSIRNRPNLGSFTIEESESERRRLRAEPEGEEKVEAFSLSLPDVEKAMDLVAAHEMADPDAIQALREQVLECPEAGRLELVYRLPDGRRNPASAQAQSERTLMVELMKRRHRAYAFGDEERGRLDVDKIPMIRIHIVPHEPWNMRGARYPNPDEEEKVVDYLDGKIRTHAADYSSGPYVSPWFCFIKPNGTLRWVQDLKRLNAVTVRDAGGLPNADALSESCVGKPIISLIDLYSRYDQFPVYPPDRPVAAMHTPRGLIHMNVAPQGWTNAVAMVQRAMIRAMQSVSPHITQPYIDDLAVKGPAVKESDEVLPGRMWTKCPSQDDELEEGEIKEVFRAEEYNGNYLELGLLLSCEMRLRDASDRAQRMMQRYLVRDGHLFVRREVGNPRRVVCGRNRQIDVIAVLHDGIAGGHRGVQATYVKISELYYWDGMMDMIGKFCRPCVPCQERSRFRQGEPLHPRLEQEVGAVVHLDLLFMPLGDQGYNYIFDARDNLSGFVDGRAIRTKIGPVLVSCIEEYYLRYPFVREFVMDRGSEFTCQEVQKLLSRSDFTKIAMPRGGKGTRPPRRPLGASEGYERHGPRHRESTPVYDDGDIELFLDSFWEHARHTGWTVARAIERLRGAGRFEEPIARIRREATTRPEVEMRMQELRPSPVGPNGRPICLEIGNAADFIPAFEWFMQGQGKERGGQAEEVPREGVPREGVPREEVPREEVPREEVPREEMPRKGVRDTQRERGLGDEGRRAGKEVIEVGEDMPPQTPPVGLRLGDAPGSTRQSGEGLQREEAPLPSSEKAPSPERRAERRRETASVRREALALIDRHLAAHALEHPDLEKPAPAELRPEPCQPEKEVEAKIPKRVDLRTRETAPAGETAEENRARKSRRIEEIWQERQRLEAAGALPEQQQERQRLEAAGALPSQPPSTPAKAPEIPEMWRDFWEQRGEELPSPTRVGFGVARKAEERLDRKIKFLAKTTFDRHLLLESDLAGKKTKEEGHGVRLEAMKVEIQELRALVASQAAIIESLRQQSQGRADKPESSRQGEQRQPGHGLSGQPSVAESRQEPPMGRVILEPEEARAQREAEREAFEFRAPIELATLPIAAAGPVIPLAGEEGLPPSSSEPAQGSAEGFMNVLLEAVHSMQEEASLFLPEQRIEDPLEREMGIETEGVVEGRP
ncbi:hypothetical protein CBR_g29565 [Chara braunii]|uniref:Uncharacterized protein n=1 Tax=Chara braunii TaxID=69332 RepID=A0A388LAS9_CHABU|nr:hypothetical protein CBR_g29565 [Chara braunii]|eukprot:GBG79418.1 hypothetical protein CBR_g29565 [Chara braunii]